MLRKRKKQKRNIKPTRKRVDTKEIRQLELERYKAIYERKRKQVSIIYWVILPLFATILISARNDISNIVSPVFQFIFSLITNIWVNLLLLIGLGIGIFLFCLFIGGKIGMMLEKLQDTTLKDHIKKINNLIKRAKQNP